MSEKSVVDRVRDSYKLSDDRAELLTAACDAYGINPDPQHQPRELLSHRFYGSDEELEAPAVVLVTAGGAKVRWPLDERTEHWLRYNVFFAYKRDRKTGIVTEFPLKTLKLPAPQRHGIPEAPQNA